MTEKRFTYAYGELGEFRLKDNETGDYISIINGYSDEDIVLLDKLNALNDENEQLQKDCTALIYHNQEYRKENEQLKQILGFLKNDNAKDILEVLNLQQTEIWKLKRGVCNVIDNKIEEVKSHIITTPKITLSDNTSNMIFVAMIDLLLDLKKELKMND